MSTNIIAWRRPRTWYAGDRPGTTPVPWPALIKRAALAIFQPYTVADWTGAGGLVVAFTTKRRAIRCAKATNSDVAYLNYRMRSGLFSLADINEHLQPVYGSRWTGDWDYKRYEQAA